MMKLAIELDAGKSVIAFEQNLKNANDIAIFRCNC